MSAPLCHSSAPAASTLALRPWACWQAALIGLLVGAGWQVMQPALWSAKGYAGLLLAATLLATAAWRGKRWLQPVPRQGIFSPRSRRYALSLLVVLAAALAMAAACGARALAFQAQSLAADLEGLELRVTGVVAAMPEPLPWGLRWRFAVEQAERLAGAETGERVLLPPLLALTDYGARASGRPLPLEAGQRWSFNVRLKAPHGLRNPHGFDQELWLWEQGVQATGTVRVGRGSVPPQLLGQTWRYPLAWLRQKLRDAIVESRVMPTALRALAHESEQTWPRALGVVAALAIGDQGAIERSDWALFRATGVAHLMSISGLHITLFAWLAAALLGWAWRRSARCCLWLPAPTAALLGGVLWALGYALLSGWGLPAQRTVVMLAVVAGLHVAGLRWPWHQVWLLALAAVVFADPWALWQAGFWLSFVAVGVLFASAARDRAPQGLRARLLALLREQMVLTLALTPLTLLLFGQVSWVGIFANLLAIPWVTLVVTPLALLGLVWAPLWQLAAASVVPLVGLLQWLMQWPAAVVFLPAAPVWAALAAIAGGVFLVLRLPWPLRFLGLPLLLPALLWQPQRPAPGSFTVLAADVGQGNAVLVRTRNHSLLYDTGPRYGADNDAGQRVLVPLLRALGERLNLLILSHGDNDHTGGAAAVLQAQPQAALMGAVSPDLPQVARRSVTACAAGQRWQWDGVAFEILHPLPDLAVKEPVAGKKVRRRRANSGPDTKPNARSCVLRIVAANGAVALLAGDIERRQEQALLAQGAELRADWLLVPHHGSKTSSSVDWIAAVAPRHALVQAGYRNRYGHPAAQVVQRYRAQGAQLVESAGCGAALWSSQQPQRIDCERRLRPRYWQHAQ